MYIRHLPYINEIERLSYLSVTGVKNMMIYTKTDLPGCPPETYNFFITININFIGSLSIQMSLLYPRNHLVKDYLSRFQVFFQCSMAGKTQLNQFFTRNRSAWTQAGNRLPICIIIRSHHINELIICKI